MRNLQDKVAWITGAGTGIGEAGARALAAAGMQVVLSGRRIERLQEVADSIGERASVEVLDVADRDAVSSVAERILADFQRVDVLVNSAGINVKERNWHNVSLDDWDSVIRIDLDGAFYCARSVLPTMIKQGDGLIVNISSWAGRFVSVVTGPAYTAAKHAVVGLTKNIASELCRSGVRANCLAPGSVVTPLVAMAHLDDHHALDAVKATLAEESPLLDRPGMPIDVANGALYLACEESGNTNGHCLVIDAGVVTGSSAGSPPFSEPMAMMREAGKTGL